MGVAIVSPPRVSTSTYGVSEGKKTGARGLIGDVFSVDRNEVAIIAAAADGPTLSNLSDKHITPVYPAVSPPRPPSPLFGRHGYD